MRNCARSSSAQRTRHECASLHRLRAQVRRGLPSRHHVERRSVVWRARPIRARVLDDCRAGTRGVRADWPLLDPASRENNGESLMATVYRPHYKRVRVTLEWEHSDGSTRHDSMTFTPEDSNDRRRECLVAAVDAAMTLAMMGAADTRDEGRS